MAKNRKIKLVLAAASFVMAAVGSKVSLAYWASAVIGSSANPTGTVTSGTWDRYTTGTAISTCSALRTSVLQVATSATFHLTANLNCSTTSSPSSTTTFSGTLYGNGYTISNYTISASRRGLFYNLSAAHIQNLILDNVDVGTSSSRVAGFAGVLAGQINGDGTTISRVRIYNSSAYCSNASGVGTIAGYVSQSTTVSNVMVQNTIINNSSSSAGGILGRIHGDTVTISDVYVEGTLNATQGAGGIIGTIDNTTGTILIVNRAVVYGNTTITTSGYYAGGVVGNNLRSSTSHSLTDVFYTGALNASTNRAGTISNNITMTNTNAWAAQWSSSTIASYTNMTGLSANYTTHYVALRTSLTTSWWSTSLPNIANSGYWTYDATSYLYELKPKV
jgi:M26 IgA1-specific Metallo-endopeptidase N-terminal region